MAENFIDEDITDILTPKGIKSLKVGDVLMFKKQDEKTGEMGRVDLRITRIKGGKVFAKQVLTFTVDEVAITGKKSIFGKRKRRLLTEKELDKNIKKAKKLQEEVNDVPN